MILFKEASLLKKYLILQSVSGYSIGFVPTMGALHKGHISLITQSKLKCNITVCSIFINPTQFNDAKDFEKYPVTLENDIFQLEQSGCDILFLPSVNEMYPEGTTNQAIYDFGEIENLLEGKYRPGHFQGVGLIVHKLLDTVSPNLLLIGQKDYQQCIIIKKLVELTRMKTNIFIGETFREASGLAMSSRNLRLNASQKVAAAGIYKMLVFLKENFGQTEVNDLTTQVETYLLHQGFDKVDYIEIADAETLQPIVKHTDGKKAVALIAAFIGGIRLIDNALLN